MSVHQEKIVRGFLEIAMEIKTVDILDQFDPPYLAKFGVVALLMENSTKYLQNLILPKELGQKYRSFRRVRMRFYKLNLSIQVNQALKVSADTDAYIEFMEGEFALVAAFKKYARFIKQSQVLAQLAAAIASSEHPVIANITDLKEVYELYWVDSRTWIALIASCVGCFFKGYATIVPKFDPKTIHYIIPRHFTLHFVGSRLSSGYGSETGQIA